MASEQEIRPRQCQPGRRRPRHVRVAFGLSGAGGSGLALRTVRHTCGRGQATPGVFGSPATRGLGYLQHGAAVTGRSRVEHSHCCGRYWVAGRLVECSLGDERIDHREQHSLRRAGEAQLPDPGVEINSEMERQTRRDTTEGPEAPLGQRGAYAADTVGPSAGGYGASTTGQAGAAQISGR